MEDRQPPDASKWDTQPTVDLSSPWTSDDGVIQEYPFNHEELAEWLYQRRTGVNKNMVVIGSLVCCIPCVIDAICSLTLCHDHKTIATNQAYGKWVAISKDGVLIYDVANPKGAKGEREFCWGIKTKEIAAKKKRKSCSPYSLTSMLPSQDRPRTTGLRVVGFLQTPRRWWRFVHQMIPKL
jgi:hypothetical protein